MLYAIRICASVCVLVWLPPLTCQQRAAMMAGTRVEARVKGVPAVSTVSNAPPTCCWKVVVTVHVLERKAQEAKVLALCWREGGREGNRVTRGKGGKTREQVWGSDKVERGRHR